MRRLLGHGVMLGGHRQCFFSQVAAVLRVELAMLHGGASWAYALSAFTQ